MSPTYNDGDYVLAIKPRSPRPGRIYIVHHPELGTLIKRLQKIEAHQHFFTGDSQSSTPARLISPVKRDRILYCVIWKIPLPS